MSQPGGTSLKSNDAQDMLDIYTEILKWGGASNYTRRMNYLQTFSPSAQALLKMICSECRPHVTSDGRTHYLSEISNYIRPRLECPFCTLVHQVVVSWLPKQHPNIIRYRSDFGLNGELQLHFAGNWSTDFSIQIYDKAPQDDMSTVPYARDIPMDPISDAVIGRILGWIDNCADNHVQCNSVPTSRSIVPKRMVEVPQDPEGSLRLVMPRATCQFTALSYCWGKIQQSVTTKANVTARHDRIDPSQLPQTIQDAITLTRKLNIPYLWVDSCCIVQDDEDDWTEEASKMEFIFSSARVVIAATQAEDSTQGFLKPRRGHHEIDLSAFLTQCGDMHLRSRRVDNHKERFELEIKHFPIFKRAWCMQEISLAHRIIHFLPDEILFICRTSAQCECGLVSQNSAKIDPYGWNLTSSSLQMVNRMTFVQLWMLIVEGYSALKITHRKDLLPAISGLARRMEKFDPGQYVAGLWERDLMQQLLWTVWPRPDTRIATESDNLMADKNAFEYPSFSWISAMVNVRFCRHSLEHEVLCQAVSINSRLVTNDPFGRVHGASIVLRGYYLSGHDLWAHGKIMSNIHLDRHFCEALNSKVARGAVETGGLVLSRIICFALTHEGGEVNALLLRRRGDLTAYARIGLIEGLPRHVLDQYASETVVTII